MYVVEMHVILQQATKCSSHRTPMISNELITNIWPY